MGLWLPGDDVLESARRVRRWCDVHEEMDRIYWTLPGWFDDDRYGLCRDLAEAAVDFAESVA